MLAVLAGIGWAAAMVDAGHFHGGDWVYFSQLSDLAVGLVATASVVSGGRGERLLTVLRGAVTSYTLVTLIIYATLLGGDYAGVASSLEHLTVPILALAGWLVFGRLRPRWFWPLLWLVPPVVYLPVYIQASTQRGAPLYDFFDPAAPDFGVWVAILLAVFLAVQWVVWALRLPRRHVA